MEIYLARADLSDAKLIWEMQREAFRELLERYGDMDTNPANEPLDKVIFKLEQEYAYFYLIQADGKTVGAIRVIDKHNGSKKRISPLFVLPGYRNMGIAQAVIKKVEKIHGNNKWELDTILEEKGNLHLYEKMGYSAAGKVKKINDKLTLVSYEKI